MSNEHKKVEQVCELGESCSSVDLVIHSKVKDLGGFSVRRTLPSIHRQMIGPWIFFDHMGPATFEANNGINVRPHPHIGIATVSYLFEGEILHRDSLGSYKAIRPGDVNLMVAGNGIVHSERERAEVTAVPHTLHGLQLWMALPTEQEEINPAFYHYPANEIPEVSVDGVKVRVIMGEIFGVESPVKTFSKTIYFETSLQKGQKLTIPASDEIGVYVTGGTVQVNESKLEAHDMGVINNNEVQLCALEDSKIAVIGGQTIGNRYIEWNFVSTKKERIEQAKKDWENKQFDVVPGDEKEFIPLPK